MTLDEQTKQQIAYIARHLKMRELASEKQKLQDEIDKQEKGYTESEKEVILKKLQNYFSK